MLLRRKVCVAALFAAILFVIMASHTVPWNHFLSAAMPTDSWTNGELLQRVMSLSPRKQGTGHQTTLAPSPALPTAPPSAARGPQPGAHPPGEIQGQQQAPARPSMPCSCRNCLSVGGSDWFRERFDPRQQPVILPGHHQMDPSALHWWLGLQRSNQGQKLEDVMSQMFQVIAPPTLAGPHPSLCRSCAVVGNSGNLQHSGHGALINTHTFVIRMNRAVTGGFQQDVGNKTTHHFLYPESAVDLVGGVSLVLLPFKLRDLEWLTSALSTGHVKMTYMRVKERVMADKDKVLVVSPQFFSYVHERWTERHGRYPSTGMLALIYALHTCDQVSVFGYGADQEGNWHHYWEENRYAGAFRKTGVHNAEYETQLIQRLNQEGKITLYL